MVAYFPEMKADEKLRGKKTFVDARRQVYHDAWGICLKDLVDVQKKGGFWFRGTLYYPVLAIIANDTPEGMLINLVKLGGWACRTCL